jgi:hypothetical protein
MFLYSLWRVPKGRGRVPHLQSQSIKTLILIPPHPNTDIVLSSPIVCHYLLRTEFVIGTGHRSHEVCSVNRFPWHSGHYGSRSWRTNHTRSSERKGDYQARDLLRPMRLCYRRHPDLWNVVYCVCRVSGRMCGK